MENEIIKYQEQRLTKLGQEKFSLFANKEQEKQALAKRIPTPKKHYTFSEDAMLSANTRKFNSMTDEVENGTWPNSFIERNIDHLNSALRSFNESLRLLEQMGRLPKDFDVLGAQIDCLILEGQKSLRAEADNIVRFHLIYGFESEEEAKQKIETVDFSDTDWVAFGVELFKQVHNPEASPIKQAKDFWDNFYKRDVETETKPELSQPEETRSGL